MMLPRLLVDCNGFSSNTLDGGRVIEWHDVSEFQVARLGLLKIQGVEWQYVGSARSRPHLEKPEKALKDQKGHLIAGHYGKSAQELVDILNRHRDQALRQDSALETDTPLSSPI
jgi:hypothetical protein